jgi:rare lipoprotein A
MRSKLQQWSALIGVAVLAAGCVSPPPPTPPPPAPLVSHGVYKVGDPYQVGGVWYYPQEQPDYDETGIASWYGPGFYGKTTANGEIYNGDDLTAGHRTLPMPVNVRVTNLENGKSLVVRVNDRGPFAKGRIIDVSERTAMLLGFHELGTARVRVVYLGRADLGGQAAPTFAGGTPAEIAAAAAASAPIKIETGVLAEVPGAKVAVAGKTKPLPQPVADAPIAQAKPTGQVEQMAVAAKTKLYVQVGAFGNYQNAFRLMLRLGGGLKIMPVRQGATTLYRVRLGPFDRLADADEGLTKMLDAGGNDAQIIVDQ